MALLSPTQIVMLCAAGLVLAVGMHWLQRRAVLQRLEFVLSGGASSVRPSELVAALRWLGSNVPGASDSKLRTSLAQAGYFTSAALPVFVAVRLLGTGTVFLAALFHKGAAADANTIGLAVFLAFLTSRLLTIALKMRAESRQRAIRCELPPVVDILLIVLNSGVSIDQSLRYVTDLLGATAPLVSVVFKRYVADVDSGMPYDAAFERMGQRLGIEEGLDLAALIKQALMQGGEITGSLERFGSELAEKRVSLAREQIGRKSILLTIVMLAFFMPVLMIILAGPAVSDILDTLGTVKQQIHTRDTKL